MLESYILRIDRDLENSEFDRLLSYVSEEKKYRIQKFHRFEDAQRTLLGDVMARYAIIKRIGVQNKDFILGTNEYGKPILLEPDGIHFNISHSGNWVACAVDSNPVGIDIEEIKAIDLKIAERFFAKDEYDALLSQSKELQQKYFYMLWTLKESYLKAEGKGLSIPLGSFSVKITEGNIYAVADSETRKYHFYQSFLDDNCVYALCTFSSNITKYFNLDIGQFLNEVYLR